MARPKDYRDLIVWQRAMNLARLAYAKTTALPPSEAYGLRAQIRRAAVSVPSNIAEGHGRLTDSQFRHFLGNARGSVHELRTQFELAGDLGYMEDTSIQEMMNVSTEVMRLLNGLIASLGPTAARRASASAANSADFSNSAIPANSANSATQRTR